MDDGVLTNRPCNSRGDDMSHKKPTVDELNNKFDYHAPFGDQTERYAQIRKRIKECAIECTALSPCSSEQTRAINALHEAMMLFNAAIACNEKPPKDDLSPWVILRRANNLQKWECVDATEYSTKALAEIAVNNCKVVDSEHEYMIYQKPESTCP